MYSTQDGKNARVRDATEKPRGEVCVWHTQRRTLQPQGVRQTIAEGRHLYHARRKEKTLQLRGCAQTEPSGGAGD